MFAPKREEVMGGWRTLHYEGLHNLYIPPNNIIRVMKFRDDMGESYSTYGRDKKCI
jgi:hypothetical protein